MYTVKNKRLFKDQKRFFNDMKDFFQNTKNPIRVFLERGFLMVFNE